MENVTIVSLLGADGVEVEHAVIDHGNGEFTSMPKSVYEEQLANEAQAL